MYRSVSVINIFDRWYDIANKSTPIWVLLKLDSARYLSSDPGGGLPNRDGRKKIISRPLAMCPL